MADDDDRRVAGATSGLAQMIMHALPSDLGFCLVVFDASREHAHIATSSSHPRYLIDYMRTVFDSVESHLEPPS